MSETIGKRLKAARVGRRMTQQQVADHFGIARVSVTQWEADTTRPESDKIKGLVELFGGDADYWLTGKGNSMPVSDRLAESLMRMNVPHDPPNASPPIPVTFPNVTIGMYGAAAGGGLNDGKFILNGNRVMDVLCPPMLIGVQGAYGVFVHGNSMKPRYREGEAVFVNPHLPVRQEDYAVVQIAGEFEGDDTSGFVKQFVSRNSRELVMAQHQPPESAEPEPYSEGRFLLRFPREKVIAVHRIVWAGEV